MDRKLVISGLLGVLFGFAFAGAELNQYDTIHNMLSLRDFSPYLIMASAIATAMPLLWLTERSKTVTPYGGQISLRRWQPTRTMAIGGVIFGIGWAMTGACPGTASTTLGTGSAMGIVLIAGMLVGIRLRDILVARESLLALGGTETEPARG